MFSYFSMFLCHLPSSSDSLALLAAQNSSVEAIGAQGATWWIWQYDPYIILMRGGCLTKNDHFLPVHDHFAKYFVRLSRIEMWYKKMTSWERRRCQARSPSVVRSRSRGSLSFSGVAYINVYPRLYMNSRNISYINSLYVMIFTQLKPHLATKET